MRNQPFSLQKKMIPEDVPVDKFNNKWIKPLVLLGPLVGIATYTYAQNYFFMNEVIDSNKKQGVPMKYEARYFWHRLTALSTVKGTPTINNRPEQAPAPTEQSAEKVTSEQRF